MGSLIILTAARIASFRREGVEADDSSPACHGNASNAGMAVALPVSDKDFMQLVSPQVGGLLKSERQKRNDLDRRAGAGQDGRESSRDSGLAGA